MSDDLPRGKAPLRGAARTRIAGATISQNKCLFFEHARKDGFTFVPFPTAGVDKSARHLRFPAKACRFRAPVRIAFHQSRNLTCQSGASPKIAKLLPGPGSLLQPQSLALLAVQSISTSGQNVPRTGNAHGMRTLFWTGVRSSKNSRCRVDQCRQQLELVCLSNGSPCTILHPERRSESTAQMASSGTRSSDHIRGREPSNSLETCLRNGCWRNQSTDTK